MKRLFYIILIILLSAGCKEKFYADIPSPATGYLIVEGIINAGSEAVTIITLSRSVSLDSPRIVYEDNARVMIEDRMNNQYELVGKGSGRFESAPLELSMNEQYRLHIITSGKEYFSLFTETKISPEIDSVYWVPKAEGIEIQLNTHNDQNNSIYYYWNYVETWEYVVPYHANLKYDQATAFPIPRDANDPQIYNCWGSQASTNIILTSTAGLARDFVYAKPICFVPATGTNRLRIRYSILVRQSVLTKQAYQYFEKMRRNTEQTGSIFDAQPSQLRGNIYCRSDSSELVVGYISTSTFSEKRMFVRFAELPTFRIPSLYETCTLDTIPNNPDAISGSFGSRSKLPVDYVRAGPNIVGFSASTFFCVDCRMAGGTGEKPSFW